jgi:hypothetical protein
MKDAEIFAGVAREHGLNEERVETARQNGVSMTTLVTLLSSGRPASEVDAMLIPVTLGQTTAEELAGQARVLADRRNL